MAFQFLNFNLFEQANPRRGGGGGDLVNFARFHQNPQNMRDWHFSGSRSSFGGWGFAMAAEMKIKMD